MGGQGSQLLLRQPVLLAQVPQFGADLRHDSFRIHGFPLSAFRLLVRVILNFGSIFAKPRKQ